MFVYKITNNINGKEYVGITNKPDRRFANHKCSSQQVIGKAIQKYGVENFSFNILFKNITQEEAIKKEQECIIQYNTLTPNGYNVSSGGDYNIGVQKDLTVVSSFKNGRSNFTREQVVYIKNHRNLPLIILYYNFEKEFEFCPVYGTFKKVYHNKTYKDVAPKVEEYKNNTSFSNMLKMCSFSLDELFELREQYENIVPWQNAYKKYIGRIGKDRFWQVYNGYGAMGKYIRHEVFTKENKYKHSSLRGQGEKNPNVKLKIEDIKEIRNMFSNGSSFSEIYKIYPFVSTVTIRNICHFKTWKNVI